MQFGGGELCERNLLESRSPGMQEGFRSDEAEGSVSGFVRIGGREEFKPLVLR